MANVYQNVIENPNGISVEQLQAHIPAIFALSPSSKVTDRYSFISTAENIVFPLLSAGFIITSAMQSRGQTLEAKQTARHLIRARPASYANVPHVKGLYPEVIIVNSHNTATSLRVEAGLVRLLCLNGMVSVVRGSSQSMRHTGSVDEIVEMVFRVMEASNLSVEQFQAWQGIQLSREEQLLLAKYILSARFGPELVVGAEDLVEFFRAERAATTATVVVEGSIDLLGDAQREEETPPMPIYRPETFLDTVRRDGDRGQDLATVTSRLQEHIIRGVAVPNAQGKKRKTSRVTSVDTNINLNKMVWRFAEQLQRIKQG